MTRSRKTDLERGIRESYSLIREYETILRLSSDPKERARARHAIEEQWALTQESLDEYVSLSERLGERISDEIDEILNHFRTKDQRLLMLGEEFKGAKTRNLPPLSRHFVDRDDEIELLKERFKDYQAPIALVGLGGIGKTSLAIAAIEALEEEGRFGGGIFGLDGVQYTTLGALVMRLGELLRLDLSQRTLLEQRQAVSYMSRCPDPGGQL